MSSRQSSSSVRVCVPPSPLSSSFALTKNTKVGDLVERVVSACELGRRASYGLFLPLVPGTLPSDQAGAYDDAAADDDGDDEQDCEDVDGVWMRNNLLVSAYDLRPGDVLWLRRHRLDLSAVHASTVSYYTVISCPLQMILAEKKKLELQKPPSKARRSSSPTTLSRSSSSSPRVSADSDAFAAHLLATRRSPSPSVATPPLPDTPSPFLFPPMSPAGSDDDIAAPGHHRDDDDDDDNNNNNNNNDNSGDLSDEDWQSCPKQPHRHSSWLGTTLGSLKADLARRHDVLAEYCLDTWKCFGCKEVPSSENEQPSLEKEACSSSETPPTALDSILPFEPLSAQLLSSSMAPRANGTARRLKTVAEKKPSPPPDAALPPAYQEFSLEAPLCQVLPWFADKETHETLYFQEPLRLCDPIVNLGPGGKTAIIVIPSVRQWKTMYFEEKTTVRDAIVALLCGLTHSRGARYGLYMQLKTGVEQRFSDLDSADQGLLRLRPESERLASFELSNAQHLVLREDASSAAPLPPVCPLPPAPLLPVSRQFTILQPGEARYDVVELFFAETISQAIRRIVRHRMLLRNFTPAARTAAADSPLAVGAAPSSLASSEPADQYSDDTAGRLLSTSSPNLLSTSILSPSAGFLSGSFLSSQLLVNPPASRPPRPPPSQSASSSSAASSDAADQFAAEFCLFLPPMLSRDFSRWLEPQRRLADYPEAFYTHQLELQPLPSSQKIVVLDGVDYQVVVHLSPSLSRADNASLFVMYDDRLTVHQAEIVLTHSIKNRTVEASSYALYLKTFADLGSLIDNHTDDELLIRAEKPAGPVNDDDELHVQQQRQQLQQEQQSLSSSSGGGLSWLSAAAESASRQIFSTSLPSLGSSLGAASSSSSSSNSLPRPSSSTDAMPAAPRLQTTTSPTLVTTTEAQTSAPRSVAAGKEKKIWLNRDWKLIQYQISSNDVLTLKPRPTAVRLKEMIAAFTDLMQRPDLIPNEKVLLKDDHVMVPGRRDNQTLGSLVCTNYQIIFLPHSRSTYDEAMNLPNIHIPYATIARVTEIGGGGRTRGIEILCKDFRQMLFGFGMQSNKQRCSSFYKLISEQAFPVDRYGLRKGHEKLFAFASDEEYSRKESREDGWCLYSPKDDYARVGLCGSTSAERLWRLVSNARYELVPTYPSVFVIPRRVSMPDLLKIADFRIMRRIPATTWRHPNGATLTRCAQPSAGLGIQRCAPDENLVCALIENNANSSVLYIVDLRPMAVAVGHSVLGAGSESVASYAGCRLKFMGIGNIHAMTESCRKLQSLCGFEVEAPNWYALLSNSLWLNHISCVLQAAITIADWLDRQGCSVLIHCSDGWDRTAQVSALTQLLLDPHYRTMKGFMILVEKEWLSFGHKFAQRNSHGAKPQAQTSPIFMQFLDAVFQLCEQHPSAFEFNTDFLLEFVDHSYSCRFGTFLFNSEKERAEARVSERTASFWSYLNHNARRYVNPFYLIRESSRKADLGVAADSGKVIHKTQLLRITSTVSNLRLWRQCYLRWNMGYLPSLNKEREFVKLLQRYTATTAESSS